MARQANYDEKIETLTGKIEKKSGSSGIPVGKKCRCPL